MGINRTANIAMKQKGNSVAYAATGAPSYAQMLKRAQCEMGGLRRIADSQCY
jgi:hypothetical protein